MKRIILTAVAAAACAAQCGAQETALGALRLSVTLPAVEGSQAAPQARPELQAGLPGRDLQSGQLAALLRDKDPEVRKSAVKAARNHIQNNYANEPVLDILLSRAEREDIRVEAARTLSYAAGYRKVQEALGGVAARGAEPLPLRVMAYKGLFLAAAANSRLQEDLCEAVLRGEKDPAARRGAIWALFASAHSPRVQETLLDAAAGGEAEATRLEALKSLYQGVGYQRVKSLYRSLAAGQAAPKALRLAAIKALSGARDSSVERLLEELIRTESDGEIRAAAVAAVEPDEAELARYFHLGYKAQNGAYISPIEAE